MGVFPSYVTRKGVFVKGSCELTIFYRGCRNLAESRGYSFTSPASNVMYYTSICKMYSRTLVGVYKLVDFF
jgi:hypothetical protein